jgi:hypothetical protein
MNFGVLKGCGEWRFIMFELVMLGSLVWITFMVMKAQILHDRKIRNCKRMMNRHL